MKIFLLFIGLIMINTSSLDEREKMLINENWGEFNENTTEYRGKAGLILVNFKSDKTFESFESTCTRDNVLQQGKWEIEDEHITFSQISTKRFKDNSKRNGKILSEKDSGKIKYKILELNENSLVLKNDKATTHLQFKPTKINYFPKE